MKTGPVKVIPWLFAAAIAVVCLPKLLQYIPDSASAFANTANIVFTEQKSSPSEANKSISISDPAAVQSLVKAVRLRKKDPCSCNHMHSVMFRTGGGIIDVSFCDHCFNVLNSPGKISEGPMHYCMPKDFFAQFRSYAQGQTNEQWHVPPS